MWQRFSERARKAIFYAQEFAQASGSRYVCPEHLLLGCLKEPENSACRLLEKSGVSVAALRQYAEARLVKRKPTPSQDMTVDVHGKKVIDLAYDEARRFGHDALGTTHLLLGIVSLDYGITRDVLLEAGVVLETLRSHVERSPRPVTLGEIIPKSTRTHVRQERLASLLVGAGLAEHLFLAIMADEIGKPFEMISSQIGHMKSHREAAVAMLFENSREGLMGRAPDDLDAILRAAQIEAGEHSLDSRHLLIALLQQKNELAKYLAVAGVDIEKSREAGG